MGRDRDCHQHKDQKCKDCGHKKCQCKSKQKQKVKQKVKVRVNGQDI